MMDLTYDIVIIGGGPGGYVAAIRGAQLGAKVCLVEKARLGGTCLNLGCIPTKALYRNAEIINTLKHSSEFGISVEGFNVDVDVIHKRKQGIIDTLVGGIAQLIASNKIDVIHGTASLLDKNRVSVKNNDGETSEVSGKNIIIATGSRPSVPPIEGSDSEGIYTSDDILSFDKVPESMVVIGGGVIGMEFASIFNAMGSKVTVMEFLPSILSMVDSDLVKRLMPSLKKKGIEVNTAASVTRIERTDKGFIVSAQGKKGEIKAEAEKVLIAVGRKPLTEGLNLDSLGILHDKKGIKVDENYETNIKGVYAIGDVNGRLMLAHEASRQGEMAVEKIMGIASEHSDAIPGCIFIFPEIAYVGLTEDEAKAKELDYKTSKFMFGANGKALTLGEAEGMVKVISETRNDENIIIGVHIMGPHASDLIHEGALAVSNELDMESIASTVHAHPTLSEAFHEAAGGILGKAIHMAPAKK
jgi:dihydrolipoamide dehydrogenase